MTDDPFEHFDAAYVMGSLTPADRHAYERHLADCARCTQAVRELAGLPGVMAKAKPLERAEPAPPLPDTLLPKLLAARDQERRRRRWLVSAVGAAAAAAFVVVLAVTLVVGSGGSGGSGGNPPAEPGELAFEQVVESPVHAFGDLNAVDWGTRIDINCTYDQGNSYEERSYKLVVAGEDGAREQVAVWKVSPGEDVALTGSTDLSPDEIASVDIVTTDGVSLLRAKP